MVNILCKDLENVELKSKYKYVTRKGKTLYSEVFTPALYGGKGAYVWATGSPLFDGTGNRIGAIESIRDITGWKQTEKELLTAQKDYFYLLEHLNDVYYRSDAEGRLILASNSWAKNLGYDDISECLGKSIANVFYADIGERKRVLDDIYLNGSVSDYEVTLKKKDGTSLPVATSSYLYYDESGKVLGVEGTWRDITMRKQIEQALQENEEKYRGIFDTINDGLHIHEIDPDWKPGKFISVNEVACRMLGYTHDEIMEHGPLDFVTDYHNRPFNEIIDELSSTGKAIFETEHRRKDGVIVPVEINSHVVHLQGKRMILSVVRDITDRKRAEVELRHLTEFQDGVITNARVWLSVLDHKGTILLWNTGAEEISGYSSDEVIGQKAIWKNIYPDKEYRKQVTDTIARIIRDNNYLENFETTILSKKGEEKVISWNTKGIPNAARNVSDYIAIGMDITERKLAEEAFAKSFAAFRTVMDSLDALVYVADMKTFEILFLNQYGRKIWGDLSGKICWESLQADQKGPCSFCTNEKLLDLGGNPVGVLVWEFRNTINGHWYECHDNAIRWMDGRIVRLEVATDITDRKRAEDELQDTKRRLGDIINFLPDATFAIDREGTVIAWNKAIEEMTGIHADDMLGKGDYEYAIPFYHERRPITIDLVLHNDPAITAKYPVMVMKGQSLQSEIFLPHLNEGTGADLVFKASPLYDAQGNLTGAIESIRDITDRKRAEVAFLEANKKLNLLSGITRHDINNQLLVLNGFLTLLQKQATDPAFQDFFIRITNASSRISAMIQFTKEYEQIGVHAPTWQDCRTLVDTAAKQAPLGMVMVENDLPADMTVFADQLITKVFYNLMDNAVRYGGKITTVRFSALKSGNVHLIVCEDDGDGIPVVEKEKIFERGFGKNTGLGLALSREILSITGITIKETGEPGKGARFEIVVPKGMWRIAGKET